MKQGLGALVLVALAATTAACNSSSATTADAQPPAASQTTTSVAQASDSPVADDPTGAGDGSGVDPYCLTAAGVMSLQGDLLIAVANGNPAAYQDEVDAIDPSAAPAEIGGAIQAIKDIDEKYVADGQQASGSQFDLDDAVKPVGDWVNATCPH